MKKGCFWYLFIAWWLYPIKWLYYSLPKFIITSIIKKVEKNKQAANKTTTSDHPLNSAQSTPQKTERHKVAGTSFHVTEIQSLGVENQDFNLSKSAMIDEGLIGERVYKKEFYVSKVELIPEPENPHDSQAIRVVTDGVHIGYIKKGSCAHIHNLLNSGKIKSVACEIKGGSYKLILEDTDEAGPYEFIKDETPLHAELIIEIN